jgi:hypothetical protein
MKILFFLKKRVRTEPVWATLLETQSALEGACTANGFLSLTQVCTVGKKPGSYVMKSV